MQPASASFIDATHGWVVGSACDAQGLCRAGVAGTDDGGATWKELPGPPEQPMPAGADPWPRRAQITFTSLTDGWVFNPFLAQTDDGGRSWRMVSLPTAAPVMDVVWFNGSSWVLTGCDPGTPCSSTLWLAPSAGAAYQPAGTQPPHASTGTGDYTRALVAGTQLVLFAPFTDQGAQLAVTADGRSWKQVASPCQRGQQQLGGSASGALLDVCWAAVGGGFGPKEAWTSADGGVHWTLRSRSADYPVGVSPVGRIPENGYPNGVAMPTSVDAWMSMGREDLYETHDGGITWNASAVPGQFGGDAGGAEQVLFSDARHGWALSSGGMYRTTDGRAWSKVAILGVIPGYEAP